MTKDLVGVEIALPLHTSLITNPDERQSMQLTLSTAGYIGPIKRSSLYERPSFDNVMEKPIQSSTQD